MGILPAVCFLYRKMCMSKEGGGGKWYRRQIFPSEKVALEHRNTYSGLESEMVKVAALRGNGRGISCVQLEKASGYGRLLAIIHSNIIHCYIITCHLHNCSPLGCVVNRA